MATFRKIPILLAMSVLAAVLETRAVDFEKEILPILEENCLDCHGPDKQKSAFRVDQRVAMLKGGDVGFPAVVPGDPKASYLIEVVDGSDPDMQMPPKGDPLTGEQVALLSRWIEEGAVWPGQMDETLEVSVDLWSFQPVQRPEVPAEDGSPVDAFLNAKLEEAGITPSGPADPRSLVRRASIILTGLPPTPERVESFLEDYSMDSEEAYSALVDELMASPHFGERWAQHWLDVIRWAETNGSEANLYRKNAWIYRDYVIRAFNEDLPYDRFLAEQLAGDQLGAGEATGFLVAGPHVPAATVGREPAAIRQARADRMDEIMQTVGASVLGMTVSCARCHNHKFDPISIQDYYALTAVFQGVEFGGRWPEFGDEHPRRERAKEIQREMYRERVALLEGAGQWTEDWGGFTEHRFRPRRTRALRIEFERKTVGIDELEVFGPENQGENLAAADRGTELKTDDSMTKPGNELAKANDGEIGTMAWRTLPAEDGSKPWVEIHFPGEEEVSRFRFSTNREYYFETDYLQTNNNASFPGVKISALQEDGTWKEVGKTGWAKQLLQKDPKLAKAHQRLHDLIGELMEEGPRYSFVGRFTRKPPVTKVLHRGSPENPRDEVVPAGFEVLDGDLGLDSATPDPKRRMKFAEWVTREEHPLTARVMVNRLWHHVFGAGIVPTGSDFGVAGASPSHPELLDWLAAEFVEGDEWSMKSMIRRLVMTDAFRRSSEPVEAGLQADAGSSLLWRFPPRRVEAEVIRDGILQASGKLDPALGGRGFRIHNVKKTYAQWEVVDNHGPETWRRMIYQERMRRVDDRMFTAFDFPDCGQVRAKRPVSTTPLQALNLMNSEFVVEQSKFLAERAGDAGGIFRLLLNREPTADELAACEGVDLVLVARSLINSNEFAFLP